MSRLSAAMMVLIGSITVGVGAHAQQPSMNPVSAAAPSLPAAPDVKTESTAPIIEPDSTLKTMLLSLDNKNFEDWRGSLFYPLQLNDRLFAVFSLLEQGQQEKALELVGIQQEKEIDKNANEPSVASVQAQQPLDAPLFFLSSIMYRSKGNWALWLNGQRLTARKPNSPDGTIEVVEVSPYAAIFSWAPVQFPRVHNRMIAAVTNEKNTVQKPTDIPLKGRIAAKPLEKRLLFMLNNNQTFYTENVRFAEGIPYRDGAALAAMDERAQLGGTSRKEKALAMPVGPAGSAPAGAAMPAMPSGAGYNPAMMSQQPNPAMTPPYGANNSAPPPAMPNTGQPSFSEPENLSTN
jgi:hypothetical protein